jgi:hypothetical protein
LARARPEAIRNEKRKLLANWLDRASTAVLAATVVPLVLSVNSVVTWMVAIAGIVGAIVFAGTLHLGARSVLEDLEE